MSHFPSSTSNSAASSAASASASADPPAVIAAATIRLDESEQKQSDQLHQTRRNAIEAFRLAMQNVNCGGCEQVASAKSEGIAVSEFYLLASVAYSTANLFHACPHCSVRRLHQWTIGNNDCFIHTVVLIGWRIGADAFYIKTSSNRSGRKIKKAILKPLLTDRQCKGHALRVLGQFLNDFDLVSSLCPIKWNLMSVVDGGCATSFLALAVKPFEYRSTAAAAAVTLQETPADLLKEIYTLCLPYASSTKTLDFSKVVYLVQLLSWILNCTLVHQVWPVLRGQLRSFEQLFIRSGISLPTDLPVTSFVSCVRGIYHFTQQSDETLCSIRFAPGANQQNDFNALPSIEASSPSSPPMSEASTLLSTPLTSTLPLGEEVESPDSPIDFLVGMEVDGVNESASGSSSSDDGSGLTEIESQSFESNHMLQDAVPAAAIQSNSFSYSAHPATLSSQDLPSVAPTSSCKRRRSDSTRQNDSEEEELHQDKRYKESTDDDQILEWPLVAPPVAPAHDIWPDLVSSSSPYPVTFTPYSPFPTALSESSDMSDSELAFPSGLIKAPELNPSYGV